MILMDGSFLPDSSGLIFDNPSENLPTCHATACPPTSSIADVSWEDAKNYWHEVERQVIMVLRQQAGLQDKAKNRSERKSRW